MILAATNPEVGNFTLGYAVAAICFGLALPVGAVLIGLLWHRVIEPSLTRADDRICDAVDAMSVTPTKGVRRG